MNAQSQAVRGRLDRRGGAPCEVLEPLKRSEAHPRRPRYLPNVLEPTPRRRSFCQPYDRSVGFATALGAVLGISAKFDVPVRFDADHMAVTIESYRLPAWQQIRIVELRT
jgi:hypothetical protein